jgi:hypothetical protein
MEAGTDGNETIGQERSGDEGRGLGNGHEKPAGIDRTEAARRG